jgi:predicted RNase H-like HicB family nuclease
MKTDYGVQILWSQQDGAYLAVSNELPGCVADGQTLEEALANFRIIVQEWIDTAKEEGREIPKPMTVEDLAQAMQQSQANLQQHIKSEVDKAAQQVFNWLMQQRPAASTFHFREGLVFNPSENLEIASGSHHR